MSNLQKIKRALISVSDKENIIDLAKFLENNNIEIISTGGTYKLLQQNNIKAIEISDFTGFPEIMDGRVKTLHPKVHGALLAIPDNKKHQEQAQQNNIQSIDLVIINLYPFVQTLHKNPDSHDEIIENIDIGGPSMIRSTAKNYNYKTIISDKKDYAELIKQISNNNNSTDLEFRKKMACKAFTNTANYDQAISSYFNSNINEEFPEKLLYPATLSQKLRYGENSHQKAAIYQNDLDIYGIANAKQFQGKELSYNNFNDSNAAFNAVSEFDQPACAIIKHANPCGISISDNILEAYEKAFEADSKSAFGGIVALNREVNSDLAQEISKIFFEVIIAPSFSQEALEIFAKKKNLRLLSAIKSKNQHEKEIKSISGGILVQDIDQKTITSKDITLASNYKANQEQIDELIFAMSVCKHVKSNAIVITNARQNVGIGAGQTSRVDSVEIACKKAENFTDINGNIINKAQNAVLASDAFFPFADGLEYAAKKGIKAMIAPKGSIRDQEVIDMANKYQISLYFIESRHFKH